jgi:hypothetical protein
VEASPGAPTLRSPSRRDSFCCADPPRARDRPQCSWKFSKVRVLVYFLGTTEDVLLIQYRKRVSRWYKFSIVSARARERPECWNKFSKVGVLEHFLCRTYPGTLTFENLYQRKNSLRYWSSSTPSVRSWMFLTLVSTCIYIYKNVL